MTSLSVRPATPPAVGHRHCVHMVHPFGVKGLRYGAQGGSRRDHVVDDDDTSHITSNASAEFWTTQSRQPVLTDL